MITRTSKRILIVLFAALATACGPQKSPDVATPAPIVQSAATPEIKIGGESPTFPGHEMCAPVAALAVESLGLPADITQATFNDPSSGLSGPGCTVALGGTGEVVTDWGRNNSNLLERLKSAGWEEDLNFSGGGAEGLLETFRRDGVVCRYISSAIPASQDLCSGNEALAACMERLAPGQRLYSVKVDCSPDSYTPGAAAQPQANPEVVRIEFPANTTQWQTPGDLAPNAIIQFVLYALEGQQMTVSLSTEPASEAFLSIWGADGEVLISDHSDPTGWSGTLPSTQDYTISIRSISQQSILYSLVITIPPVTLPEAMRIEFQPNATQWHTPGDLAPNATMRFVLYALAGQQMTIKLTTEPASGASLYIWGADGTVYTFSPTLDWTGVLPATQDYYVEIRSTSTQRVLYTLVVTIP